MEKINNINHFYNKLTTQNHLIGASLLRILFGIIILYNYIVNYGMRHFFWHDSGVISDEVYNSMYKVFFSPYGLNDSVLYFEILYHSGFIFALLFTIGFGGKIVHILNYIFYLSLISRNSLISDGGDNIMSLCLLYMIFLNTTAYYSIKVKPQWSFPKILPEVKSVLHNFALLFIIVQICIMYFFSGIFQVMGEKWNNGTALYYILQVDTFSKPFWEQILTSNDYFIVLFTYASILVKLAFPFSLFNKWSKYVIVTLMMGFHLGIAIAMGLITFSAIMIAIEVLVFSDKEYKKAFSFLNKLKFFKGSSQQKKQKGTTSLNKEVV
ncbi:HTTM domain-containing protein [Cytobacillus stercorigallinarum]|uniref:HTTM domain-containing protein n=1 Tax=Cytobacillus stercorigallinarum TaxID=2762240 RepID=UPI00296B13FC|nr:HTTM domain-containing protein [Cytobacillus stercorigallinarum]